MGGNLKGFWNKQCSICNEIKPARTHHDSVSGTCVFQMSHYCLFTNNCVGLENQRFFLLFIFYAWLGSAYYLLSLLSIWNHFVYRDNQQLMTFLLIFDAANCGWLFIYNLFMWALASSGLTLVEFVGRQSGFKQNYYDFTFSRSRDNIFKIF